MSAIVQLFEHSLTLPFFGIGLKMDFFQSCGHCWVFQICWHIECNSLIASSFRIRNSSTGIPSPSLALFVVMLLRPTWLYIPGCLALGEWSHFSDYLSWRSFLYSSFYSCHLFWISHAFVRSITFMSFTEPIFPWNVALVSLIFLKRSLVFPILLFSSISFHWSLRKTFFFFFSFFFNFILFLNFTWGRLSYLFLLFFGTLHSDAYIFSFLLCFSLLFFSQLFVRLPQTAILLFCFSWGWSLSLSPAECHKPPSIVRQALHPLDLVP